MDGYVLKALFRAIPVLNCVPFFPELMDCSEYDHTDSIQPITFGHKLWPSYYSLSLLGQRLTTFQAVIAHFLLLDFPLTSKRLTQPERRLAHERLLASHTSTEVKEMASSSDKSPLKGALRPIQQSFKNRTVWLFTVGYMVSPRKVQNLRS